MKAWITGLAFAGAAMLSPARADAAIVIDFDQLATDGGSVTATGGGNAVGEDIIFTSIFLRDTSLPTGSQNLAGVECGDGTAGTTCMLDFNTATGTFTVTAVGGLFDIGGDFLPFTADTGAQIVGANTVILTGTIGSFVFIPGSAFLGFGMDTKDADLLEFFGLGPNLSFNFSNSELLLGLSGENVLNADLVNIVPIPEPGALALLGLGLVAAGRAARRRRLSARD